MKYFVRITCLVSLLAACKQSSSSNSTLSTRSSQGQEITGSAYFIAPITNAHVKVTRLATGNSDELIIESQTDDKGQFDLVAPSNTDGDLLIEVIGDRGGTTIEPVTGVDPISLSESDDLMALAIGTQLGGKTSVEINPLSTLVAARAVAEYRAGGTLSTAYTKNSGLFSAHFQTATPWLSSPVDLLSTAAPGLSSGVIYSLAVVGLSQQAFELGERASVSDVSVVNSLVVLRALVADISSPTDRVFDGKRDGQPLNITGNVFIDQETTRLSLAQSMSDFLGSSINQTGLTARDVTQILNAVRQDVSELYPGSPQDITATGQSGAPPTISITAPQVGKTLGAADSIVGFAQDTDGIGSLEILIDGTQVSVDFDETDPTKWTFTFVPSIVSGAHTLEVDATDKLGNASQQQVQFAFDNQPPVIAFVDCNSPDDRARTATVSLSGVTYADTTTINTCAEASLNVGSQAMYSYADLYEGGTSVSTIRLSVTDQSAIASVAYRVETNGIEVQAPQTLPTAAAPATHAFSINLATLGLVSTAVHAGDTTTVEIIAVDQNGNKSTRALSFHLDLIPTPLDVAQTTTDSATSLQGHTFALGNIYQLFNYTTTYDSTKAQCGSFFCNTYDFPYIELVRYVVTNVSSRALTLDTTWANATQGTMDLRRWVYRTYYFSNQSFPTNSNNPCAEITEAAGYGSIVDESGFLPFSADYSTQKCYSLANDFLFGKRWQSLSFTPEMRVYSLGSNTQLAGPKVTLAPGQQYAFVIGAKKFQVPGTTLNLANAWPWKENYGGSSTMSAYYMYGETTLTRSPLDYQDDDWEDAQTQGFLRPNVFMQNPSGTTSSLWGAVAGFYASHDYDYVDQGNIVDAIYVSATGRNHLVSPVVLERGVELTGNLTWTVPVSMSAADPSFTGTGNLQPASTFAEYFDQPAGVTLCPWTNPLCNVDMSGW